MSKKNYNPNLIRNFIQISLNIVFDVCNKKPSKVEFFMLYLNLYEKKTHLRVILKGLKSIY